jgi:outer membrane biosynthesis protein TonB
MRQGARGFPLLLVLLVLLGLTFFVLLLPFPVLLVTGAGPEGGKKKLVERWPRHSKLKCRNSPMHPIIPGVPNKTNKTTPNQIKPTNKPKQNKIKPTNQQTNKPTHNQNKTKPTNQHTSKPAHQKKQQTNKLMPPKQQTNKQANKQTNKHTKKQRNKQTNKNGNNLKQFETICNNVTM